jgi:hypothetical protein
MVVDSKQYAVGLTRIYFYCFECGPDIDDPSAPGKKKKDTPGQRVMKAEWRKDSRVYCPRCKRLMIFDGDALYDNVTGNAHFWIERPDGLIVPRGHLFRYDLKGEGYVSPRYISPKPGDGVNIDFVKEYDRLNGGNSAVQQMP